MAESSDMGKKSLQVVVFAGDPLAVPAINLLLQQQSLAGVILAEQEDAFSYQLAAWLQQIQCSFMRFNSAKSDLLVKQFKQWGGDLAVTFNFLHSLEQTSEQGTIFELYHFHAASLIQYNGPRPLYWKIRDSQQQTQLILQKAHIKGAFPDIAVSQNLAIHSLDTLQCLEAKAAQQGALMLAQLLTELTENNGQIKLQYQQEKTSPAKAAPEPQESDLHVDWLTMSSQQIAALARAGNAQFGGCIIVLGQTPLNLLQATPVKHLTYGVNPGTICFIGDPEGVIVATCDSAVRLDILSNADGVFNGLSFTERFGINAGMDFISVPVR